MQIIKFHTVSYAESIQVMTRNCYFTLDGLNYIIIKVIGGGSRGAMATLKF